MSCELFLEEHEDDAPCDNVVHQEAIKRRRAGAAEWSALERRYKGVDGWRDFLDGQPIHCGTSLELQACELHADDYGQFNLRLSRGIRVRYELDVQRRVVLYADVDGFLFEHKANDWMRFRWPRGRR